MKELLKLDHIQKYYGNEGNVTRAIRDIDFSVMEGEFLGIMGASGSGKTTMLNCISTIDTIPTGKSRIYLSGFSAFRYADDRRKCFAGAYDQPCSRERDQGKGAEYCTDFKNNRHIGEISVSGFRRTEAEVRLRQSDHPSAKADPCR